MHRTTTMHIRSTSERCSTYGMKKEGITEVLQMSEAKLSSLRISNVEPN